MVSGALIREFLIPHQAAFGERMAQIRRIATHPEVRSAANEYEVSQAHGRLFKLQLAFIKRGNWLALYFLSWLIVQRMRLNEYRVRIQNRLPRNDNG